MSDESFEWEESDEKYTTYNATNEISSANIFTVSCPECGDKLYNQSFDPDADSPSWLYECHDCELYVRVAPTKVSAYASDMNL